tara:strand:- start:142 stop:441 length:300 start_codon:yes stop_codon:yes gene_type:complete
MEKTCSDAYSIYLQHYKPDKDEVENEIVNSVCEILNNYQDRFINYQQFIIIHTLFKASFENKIKLKKNKLKLINSLTKIKFCNYENKNLSTIDIMNVII